MTLIFRTEIPTDAPAIEALTLAAFKQAPHTSHTEHLILRALRRTGRLTVSLVAQDGAQLVGHVALSPVRISDGTPRWFGLGPISVLPARQRQGIGTQLMVRALASLRERGAAGCVLVGDPAYYGRFGFTAMPQLQVAGVPPMYVLAHGLDGPVPAGLVSFDPAFAATA
ncbi:GNAT family N-acetyltransferase [Bordetella pseudohinzii]|uniref:GCN5 family acetyltransferase n=1 Tax=Bordetella pseudohinzii TaxID=1331258 RepID=A0A0J6C220_9BORD|nr:N-acetyltransferase [Bordetella pseudohinzii]ANY15854.1 GCN5 family acetyltransferase [Bordetella pseudohinzii]KMM25088.1 GCN5 family acetyltransferase [Bordetella pseudohinzii]KXA80326.1 GCN5 family acetyltransferase [Bordetella pseudohinzii]KXA81420.1 GCN5 family acetyltransferase [Bordetella pseudohinzii]CUI44135.1 Predicted acetyltransferase [Bordetella pseudohinzii]